MLVRTYLDESKIHGLGVFAYEKIQKGTQVWEYNKRFDKIILEKHLRDEAPPLIVELFDTYAYVYKDEYLVLDCDNGRFMNHSETPNCEWLADCTGFALRDIQHSEEITCNYKGR